MSDLHEIKAEARRAAFDRRKAAHEDGAAAKAAAATEAVLGSGLVREGAVVSAYLPIRTEITPMRLMRTLHDRGHRICVPVIEGKGLPLVFREWRPGVVLEKGPFDVQVPAEGDWLSPDCVVAPMLAFDLGGWRLGYGGGFYDRTLAKLRAERPTVAIGFAYAAQQVDEVPRDETDQRLDAVATEAGVMLP